MSQADWKDLTGTALDTGSIRRGVSSAFVVPNGGSTFIYGLRALVSTTGAGGKYCDLADFKPIVGAKKGGSVSVAMKRLTSGITYAPFIGLLKGTDPATAIGYYLGLTQETSYKIGLFKGTPATGLSASAANLLPGRSSTATYTDVGDTAAAWHHLRLDVLSNPHGEVVLNVYKNNLDAVTGNPVTAPVWEAIPGISQFIDDPLGFWSGSAPHEDGFYVVYGMYTNNGAGEACAFDHVVVQRQITP